METFEENCEINVKPIPFKVLTVLYKDGFQTMPHWHKSQEIISVKSGSIQVTINNAVFSANEGDIVLINAFDVHAVVGDAIVQVLQFEINRNIYQIDVFRIFTLPPNVKVLTAQVSKKEDIEKELQEVFRAYEIQNDAYQINILGCIYKIIYFVSQISAAWDVRSTAVCRHRVNVEKVDAVLKYVETHYDTSISIEDVSGLMCLSPSYFCRFFKSVMGITFFEYLNIYRCDKAEYLLKSSEKSVTDISYDVGFSSVQYFNRIYKRYKNKRPLETKRTAQTVVGNI